jgi:hypothetical protein
MGNRTKLVIMIVMSVGGSLPAEGVLGLQTSEHVAGFHPRSGVGSDTISLAEAQAKRVLAFRYIRPVHDEKVRYEAIGRAQNLAAARRPEMIQELDALGEVDPTNDFIIGHRVKLRMTSGRREQALEVARTCRGTDWWCAELTGLVFHSLGDFVAADSAFQVSYAAMPESERCGERGVSDIGAMLQGRVLREYRRLGCGERQVLESRFWWLADPLHLMEANDRLTEHRARLVGLRLLEQQQALRGRWGAYWCYDRCWEGVLRHGWPVEFWGPERDFASISHLPGVSLAPPQEAVENPMGIDPDDWELEPRAGRERYDLPYGPLYSLPQQVAFFRRGDSARVVAATDFRGHPLALSGAREVGMVLSRGPADVPVRVSTHELLDLHRFQVTVPDEHHLVSVEAVSDRRGVGRARFATGLVESSSGGLGLSNLLLFDWSATQGETLDRVFPHMMGTTEVTAESAVGVFWEVYGVEERETLSVTLQVTPEEDGGFFRRIGRVLRLVGATEGVRLGWEAPVGGEAILGNSLQVDLGTLDPGRYRLEVTVELGDDSATESRRFSVL